MNPPKTKKLFISYRSNDAIKVDKIALDLTLLRYDDGTPRYVAWQDKHNLPPASPNWWDAIVDAIESCDIFVFNLSHASLQSEVCRAELEYAHKRNRPIIPVVLDGEFFLNPQTGKYDLPKETWALVPDWLGQAQFLFHVQTQFYGKFQEAVEVFERNWPRDIPAARPLNPDSRSVHSSNHALYGAACDYAQRLAFTDAEKHFDVLVRRNDEDYADLAAQWLNLIRRYAELIEIVEHRSPAVVFNRKQAAYQALFPNDAVDGIFDPRGLLTPEQKRPAAEQSELRRMVAQQAETQSLSSGIASTQASDSVEVSFGQVSVGQTLPVMYGASTHSGNATKTNQDSYGYKVLSNSALFLVVDGMGGHADGEKAARIAVDTVLEKYSSFASSLSDQDSHTEFGELLSKWLQAANERTLRETPNGGSTASVCLVTAKHLYIAHIGNTRVYRLSDGKLEQLTRDHSLVQRLFELNQIKESEKRDHPQKNVLYRALGQMKSVEIDVKREAIHGHDTYMICSDGLWDHIDEAVLLRTVIGSRNFKRTAAELVQMAARSSTDDITAILFRLP
jgi:protein phosphatase